MLFRRFLTLLVVFLLILGVTGIANANSNVTLTTRDNVQLRSGPGRQYDSLARVPFNTSLPGTGRNDDNSWIQANYNGTIGWIAAYLLNWVGDINSLPVGGIAAASPPPAAAAPAAQPLPAGSVSATNAHVLNLRIGPSSSSSLAGQLPAGSTIGLTGRWGSGGSMWVRFDLNGQTLWVAGWLLTINGDANALPDVQAAQNAVLTLCGGGSAPEATPYNGGAGIHPIVLLNETGGTNAWNSQIGNWGVGRNLGAAQLVGCVSAQTQNSIETCFYNIGPNIVRYEYSVSVRVINAQTGQVIGATTLSGSPPRNCRNQEPISLAYLYGGSVTLQQVRDFLQPFVHP